MELFECRNEGFEAICGFFAYVDDPLGDGDVGRVDDENRGVVPGIMIERCGRIDLEGSAHYQKDVSLFNGLYSFVHLGDCFAEKDYVRAVLHASAVLIANFHFRVAYVLHFLFAEAVVVVKTVFGVFIMVPGLSLGLLFSGARAL